MKRHNGTRHTYARFRDKRKVKANLAVFFCSATMYYYRKSKHISNYTSLYTAVIYTDACIFVAVEKEKVVIIVK